MLKALSDVEYDEVVKRAPKAYDVCPTCDGRSRRDPESGMERWESPGYYYEGKHHECDCKRQIALFSRYTLANIGKQYMTLDWSAYDGDPEVIETVENYIEKWKDFFAFGFGLTFSSPTQGVGKTFSATHIAKEMVKRNQRVYFIDFVCMVDGLMGEEKRDIEARMKGTKLLVLDDVVSGISERQNDLYALKFESIVRHRTNWDLPTIFTTNLTEGDFESWFPRIYSLVAPKQMWVPIKGSDFRRSSTIAEQQSNRILKGERAPIT